jgi:hypothetical protein
MVFFEKKIFPCWAVPQALPAPRRLAAPREPEKSLFASFSSEKEDSCYSLPTIPC